MTMETVIQFCGIAGLCIVALIAAVFAVCAIIDFTRGVEEGVGSLADEERERDEKEKGGAE